MVLEDTLAFWWDSDWADKKQIEMMRAAIERHRIAYDKERRGRRRAHMAERRKIQRAAAPTAPDETP